MRATFKVEADAHDITALIRDRLLEIHITDKPGLDSDEMEIKLDDRDGAVAFPRKGAKLQIWLGWDGSPLANMGSYVVDEIGLSIAPQILTIKGKPADMRATAKTQRSQGYEATTLSIVVATVAARQGWEPVCQVSADIARADQLGESDLHFITRIARAHGATATVKAGKLLVMPRGGGSSAGGKPLPTITLRREDLSGGELTFPDRAALASVKARAHNPATGQKIEIEIPNVDEVVGTTGAVHVDRHDYPSEAQAKAGAKACLEASNRSTATGSLSMLGRGDIGAESAVRLVGIKAEVDGDYLVESVSHVLAGDSWVTTLEINAGNQGKAAVGHPKGKPKGKKTELVIPDAEGVVK